MAADGAPSLVHLPGWRAGVERVEIAGDEAHYLTRVVRVRVGETVSFTDGRGTLGTLEVDELGTVVRARVASATAHVRAATLELWCGAPEGDRADWLVEKLAELGVATLVPVHGKRARWERFDARRERWERLATAALRQSRSPFRMVLAEPVTLAEALARAGDAVARWLGEPEGAPAREVIGAPAGCAVGAIGPSSGFTDDEKKALSERGFGAVRLAGQRLRTETAALAMAALWSAAGPGPEVGGIQAP